MTILYIYYCVSKKNDPFYTVCPGISPILCSKLLYNMGHYFLDTQYKKGHFSWTDSNLLYIWVTTTWTQLLLKLPCVHEVVTHFM